VFDEIAALRLLNMCRGDEIWSPEFCREHGVPEGWIEELSDCYESGFRTDRQTIYVAGNLTNQYHGVKDRDLAFRLAEFLGVDSARVTSTALGPAAEVRALKEAVEEG
jgi:hypothetical protein